MKPWLHRLPRHWVWLAVVPLVLSGAEPLPNLLSDGGFESPAPGAWEKRTPDGPERTLSITSEAARSGRQGARIVNTAAATSRWRQGANGTLQVPAGATVRLSGWIRTELGAEGGAALRLYCIGATGEIRAQPQSRPVRGRAPWRRVSVTAKVPEGCDHLMAYLELDKAVGRADYDDVSLSVLPAEPERPELRDLLLLSDTPAGDPAVLSWRTLYPDRLVVAAPQETPHWEAYRGMIVFARGRDPGFDFNAIEAFARCGNPVVMDLEVYAQLRQAQVRERSTSYAPSLRIVREDRLTAGFKKGDTLPWGDGEKGHWTQRVLEEVSRERVLAESLEGGALVVAETMGKGLLLASDLKGLGEPLYHRPGSFNKYLFAGNALGATVRFGRHYAERLKYAEFVESMRQLATEYPAWRVEDEGPASGDYRIHSLHWGDAAKPTFLIYGVTHGSEWEPAYGLLTLARSLAAAPPGTGCDLGRFAVKIIPILNPAGYERNTRQNAASVDLNRNGGEWWESFQGRDSSRDGTWGPGDYDWKGSGPFSEPETQTFRAICERTPVHAVLDFHGNTGGPGNNRLVVLPLSAREDNEDRADAAVSAFNEAMRNRYVLRQANRPAVAQYDIEATHWDAERPTLIESACRGRYGFLCEVPAGYPGTYGMVMQTDIVVETCLAFLKAYQGP